MEFFSKFKAFASREPSKMSLTSSEAYVISCIGKKRSMEELFEYCKNTMMNRIHCESETTDNTRLYYHFPSWLNNSTKDQLKKYLEDESYKVLYFDYKGVLISWEQE